MLFIAQQDSLRDHWLYIFISHISSKSAIILVYVDLYFLFYNLPVRPKLDNHRDEIPDFLFRTCMSKIRNTGISSISLTWEIRSIKIIQTFPAVLVYGHVTIIWSY